MVHFNQIVSSCTVAFKQNRIAEKVKELAIGLLNCYGRHTVTGMITGCGKQFVDWSATYRIFSQNRIKTEAVFKKVVEHVVACQPTTNYLVAHMDDTLIRKTGKKIPGTSWKRDPLGPPFHTNFVWGQRYIQLSMALTPEPSNCQSRSIPIDFYHCPTPIKPKKDANEAQINEYKEAQKKSRLTKQGCNRIRLLRAHLDGMNAKQKQLIISVDGSYTNKEVLKNLPNRTTLIGRIRKDTALNALPITNATTGRKKVYGELVPTPEQVRQDEKIEWTKVTAWAAGKSHPFHVKVVKNLKWRSAGEGHTLQMVVIRPLGYRLTKDSRILYRQPAYLICTDNNLDIETLLQAYLWRWEIEVNFRDEKTILGCGQAQVRNENAVKNLPAFTTAIYSMLHLAANKSTLKRGENVLPTALWDNVQKERRLSTNELINNIRCELWSEKTGMSFSHFVKNQLDSRSLRNAVNPNITALFYAKQ